MDITIFHNVTHDGVGRNVGFFGYQRGHALVPVFTYNESLADFGSGVHSVAERAFHLFNVGDDPDFGTPDQRALAYRAARNRSLSTGDAVLIRIGQAQHWIALGENGWEDVPAPAFVVWASCHGTTALDPRQHPLDGINPPLPSRH
jgi:hypothetical protein